MALWVRVGTTTIESIEISRGQEVDQGTPCYIWLAWLPPLPNALAWPGSTTHPAVEIPHKNDLTKLLEPLDILQQLGVGRGSTSCGAEGDGRQIHQPQEGAVGSPAAAAQLKPHGFWHTGISVNSDKGCEGFGHIESHAASLATQAGLTNIAVPWDTAGSTPPLPGLRDT
jgi:hypothetical protein